jgi:ribosomal protein S18 acetylase RimI-like enzyme
MSDFSDRITLRRATVDDAAAFGQLAAATFVETFGHLYPPEDLQGYLKSYGVELSRAKLSDPRCAVWFAEDDGTPIGFIAVGACKLPVENLEPEAAEVQQLYVLAKYHNLKLGTRLMDTGLEWLASQGRGPIYVGVWSQNFGAQRFYARYGFVKVGDYGFPVGKTVDHEFILKRE